MKKLLLVFLLAIITTINFGQAPCDLQYQRFAKATNESQALTDAIDETPELIHAWEVLDNAEIADLSDRIDDIRFVSNYLETNPGKVADQVSDDIKNKGWKRWLDEIIGGSANIVDEIVDHTRRHIHKGEIRISFKDGTPDFISSPDQIWNNFKINFETDDSFAEAILKQDNIKGQKLSGLHNLSAFDGTTKNGNLLLTYDSKSVIGSIGGKVIYIIENPRAFIPDIDNLKSINKNKTLDNRIFTESGRYILKTKVQGKRISGMFPEGMQNSEIEEMVSRAFNERNIDGRKWTGEVQYGEMTVKIEGYINEVTGDIDSAYIVEVNKKE